MRSGRIVMVLVEEQMLWTSRFLVPALGELFHVVRQDWVPGNGKCIVGEWGQTQSETHTHLLEDHLFMMEGLLLEDIAGWGSSIRWKEML